MIEKIEPKYLTKDEYFQMKGIKLALEICDSDDPANDPERFIIRVENKVIQFLKQNFRFSTQMINNKTIERFKMGLIEQVEEEITNGKNAPICENAKGYFRDCGFMNLRIY